MSEAYPEIPPEQLEAFLTVALVFNLQEMKSSVERLNSDVVQALSTATQPTEMRYMIRALDDGLTPAEHDRFMLGPRYRAEPLHGVVRMIVKVPLQEAEYFPEVGDKPWWNDIFLELQMVESEAENYLLNYDGLKRYNTADDLVMHPDFQQSGNLFMVNPEAEIPSALTINDLNALMREYQFYRQHNKQ